MSPEASDVLHTLVYFHIFKYPLKLADIVANSTISNSNYSAVQSALTELQNLDIVNEDEGIYYIGGEKDLVERRQKGNALAVRKMKVAKRMSCFIAKFPFVEGVSISGSMSKGYMDKTTDIDFFIITRPGRLWLSRTMLVLFKKLFLLNSHKHFCVNYFIDSDHLEIPDKNLFTAKELAYLIPTYNNALYAKLLEENSWAKTFLPNFDFDTEREGVFPKKNRGLKRVGEWLFSGVMGNALDKYCMYVTERYWRKKHGIKGKDIRVRCYRHTSKYHPGNFQEKVLSRLSESLKEIEAKYNVKASFSRELGTS